MQALLGLQSRMMRTSDFLHVVLGYAIASDLNSAMAIVVDISQAYREEDSFRFLKCKAQQCWALICSQ